MNPRARHAYLTLVANRPLLNIVLPKGELLCIEISEGHLSNIAHDSVKLALRPDKRRPVWRETMR